MRTDWIKIVLVALLVVVAGATGAVADPSGDDIKCVADTTISFTTGLGDPIGPSFIDFAHDGKAAIKLFWFKDGATARNEANLAKTRLIFLRDYAGPRTYYFAGGPDSAKVDLVDATEVIVSR